MRPLLHIDEHLCQACERCEARRVCKIRALVQIEPGDLPIVDASRCRGCLVCALECPYGAIVHSQPRSSSAAR